MPRKSHSPNPLQREPYVIHLKDGKALNKFYIDLDRYSDEKMSWFYDVDPKEIVSDPNWHVIQKLAKQVLRAFNYKKHES